MKHDYFEPFLMGYTAMCLMTQAQLSVFPSQEVSVHISDKATETEVTSTVFFFFFLRLNVVNLKKKTMTAVKRHKRSHLKNIAF